MAYRHKSKPGVTCTVLDASDGYVIYQYMHDGLIVTNKTDVKRTLFGRRGSKDW